MNKYTRFIFDSYAFNRATGTISLRYSLDDEVKFEECITVPTEGIDPYLDEEALDRALHALHMAGGASYYKTCVPPIVEVRTAPLSVQQAKFWHKVYENGLGEFFYKNQIDFRGMLKFPGTPEAAEPLEFKKRKTEIPLSDQKILVPVGGGKDSVVTAELLKRAGAKPTLFRMGGHPLIENIATTAELPLITVERHLAPELFELNANGALNGHVPITAYVSFLTIVLSVLYKFDAVALSNEGSASFGNVEWMGKEINHQWSKSVEAEELLQEYIRNWIHPHIAYFSALRPLSELGIVQRFCGLPQYFKATTSCNANWRILKERPKELWCGHCPKCVFVGLLLNAFLPHDHVEDIMGNDVLDHEPNIPLFKELLGIEGSKPFECVGTPQETTAAFLLAHWKGDSEHTSAMRMFMEEVFPTVKNPKTLVKKELDVRSTHTIPKEYAALLRFL